MPQFADIFTGGYSKPGVRADFIAAPATTTQKSFDALTTADVPATTEIADDSEKCMKADCDCGCDDKAKRPKLKSILQASRELLQATTKSAGEGVWRTIEGDQKVFIQDGEVRAGGPAGPVIGGKKPSTKPKPTKKPDPKPKPESSKPKKPKATSPVKEWATERFKDPKKAANFESWFGDSKVVDAEGKPLTVYHGTDKFIGTSFDRARLGSATGADIAKAGFWFSSDQRVAESYADSAVYQQVNKIEMEAEEEPDKERSKRLMRMAHRKWKEIEGQKGEVMSVFLSLQKPKVVDMDSKDGKAKDLKEHIAEAAQAGYDGVIVRNLADNPGEELHKADHYLIFNPLQVKSADKNEGTFDAGSADITKSVLAASKRYLATQTKSASDDGIWRTTEDGSKIFIGSDGTVRAGGPGGPVLSDEKTELSDTEIADALDDYSGSDGAYREVNAYLRGDRDQVSDRGKKVIESIDKLFETQAEPTTATTTVYRGVDSDIFRRLGAIPEDYGNEWWTFPGAEIETADLKGKAIIDPAFMSTSTRKDEAKKYNPQTQLRITVPKGTKVIDRGFRYDEAEVLLDRGTKLVITGVKVTRDDEDHWSSVISAKVAKSDGESTKAGTKAKSMPTKIPTSRPQAEQPDEMTEDDDAILDGIWDSIE